MNKLDLELEYYKHLRNTNTRIEYLAEYLPNIDIRNIYYESILDRFYNIINSQENDTNKIDLPQSY